MATAPYRQWLEPDHPKHAHLPGCDVIKHTEYLFSKFPAARGLFDWWDKLWQKPYRGITTDGNVITGLYPESDDGVPIESIVAAANAVISAADSTERQRLLYDWHAPERRAWSNPEVYVHRYGIRLDQSSDAVREAVLGVLKVTLSPEGYQKAVGAMLINDFLGELHNAKGVLNRWSYSFAIFGTPSVTDRWGFLLFGHHLDLSVGLYKHQIVLTPTFTGAEPNEIDEGPYSGTRILVEEEASGLRFMQELPQDLQNKAQVCKDIDDPKFREDWMKSFPNCRWNPADQRTLCGAFQDNRVVPNEGICVAELEESLIGVLLQTVEHFLIYLPQSARHNRLQQVRKHLRETYFSWIGGFGNQDVFYYRIQSPVIICEFDHHSGVFLTNETPARFHIHAVVRSPNGGDYGYTLGQ